MTDENVKGMTSLGRKSMSLDNMTSQFYSKYYDVSHTILIAGHTNPNDQDSIVYNDEKIHDDLHRNSPYLRVANDGTDSLFVCVSHGGEQTFSPENVIYPGDIKVYINVYTLRLRSPTAGLPYRVSEYDIDKVCCPTTASSNKPSWYRAAEVSAPGAGTALITKTVTAGKHGYIYGFLISAQEANDFKINWTNAGNPYSIRVVFANKGSTQDTEDIALNGLLSADAGTNITITNINVGVVGIIYQAALLYLEL